MFCTLGFFLIGCSNDDSASLNNVRVTGKIISDGHPLSGANVTLDSIHNWTVKSASDGSFEMLAVPAGNHDLYVSNGDTDGGFTQKTFNIYVDESNTKFDSVLLPKKLELKEPFDITSSTLKLIWNASDAFDFYEYKLYRHHSEGLDENTGELIYVGTDINDTTFTDQNLITAQKYYYRVFLRNEYGKLGGSNIESATTEITNLIPGGEFENPADYHDNWSIFFDNGGIVTTIVDSIFYEGSSSLYNRNERAYENGNINVSKGLKLNKAIHLNPNSIYQVSAWIRAKGQQGDLGSVWVVIKQGSDYITKIDLGVEAGGIGGSNSIGDTGWVYKSITFHVPVDEPISVELYFPIEHVWIDELQILPYE